VASVLAQRVCGVEALARMTGVVQMRLANAFCRYLELARTL